MDWIDNEVERLDMVIEGKAGAGASQTFLILN
jgi:hypothetical protein